MKEMHQRLQLLLEFSFPSAIIKPEADKLISLSENNFWSQLSLTSGNPPIKLKFGEDSTYVLNKKAFTKISPLQL